jgi:hypothetical protein
MHRVSLEYRPLVDALIRMGTITPNDIGSILKDHENDPKVFVAISWDFLNKNDRKLVKACANLEPITREQGLRLHALGFLQGGIIPKPIMDWVEKFGHV